MCRKGKWGFGGARPAMPCAGTVNNNSWILCLVVSSRFAVKSLGLINNSAKKFLGVLFQQISDISVDSRQVSILFQQLSVLIQRSNAVLLHDSFVDEEAGTGSPA